MGLGTAHVTLTTADKFIPEAWSDEIVATFKSNLVAANLVTNIDFVGKKGDTLHIPVPTRGAASAKAASTQVTLIAATESEITMTINQHWEYSRLIEDIVRVQALPSLKKFYTDDAGYALAKKVDSYVHGLFATVQGGTAYSKAKVLSSGALADWSPTANTNTGNASALTDEEIRRLIQLLDDADIPGRSRAFIIPPVEKRRLLGVSRFTEQAFTGEAGSGNPIRNGLIGELYGIPVYVSSNCETVLATDGTTNNYLGVLTHESAVALVTQQDVRSQSQYKLEYLADLMVNDTIFGGGEIRDNAAVVFVTPVVG